MGDPSDWQSKPELASGVAERLPLLINHVAFEVAGRAELGLNAIGLTGKGYMALAILEADRPRSQLELSRLIGCVPAVVVTIADELEAGGFVERQRDPADRRRSVLVVTPAGRRVLAKGDRVAKAVEDELLGHLDAEAREQLHAALRGTLESVAVPAA